MSGVLETQHSAPQGQASAGQLLRQAREAAGQHVASLAAALKVPEHKLVALEADDYAAFPDTVFMRALASSICRNLGLDAQPILDKLPRSAAKGFDAQRMHLNAPIKQRAGKSGGGMTGNGSGISGTAIGAVIALLCGAAAVYFLPGDLLDGDEAPASTVVTVPSASPAAPLAPVPGAVWSQPAPTLPGVPATPEAGAPAAMVPDAPAAPGAMAPAATQPLPGAMAPAATQPLPGSMAPAATQPLPGAMSPAATPPLPGAISAGAAPLVFNATAATWVQVKDARGAVVLQKNLNPGESVPVAAQLPASVVIGRADATTLQVRGQAFDLAAVSRDNVARFEVN